MYYIDFKLNLEILLSTIHSIPEAIDTINRNVDSNVKRGDILECNIPEWMIYKNVLTDSIHILPSDWRTLYMDNTYKYHMGNTIQYDRFEYNLQNEIDFRQIMDDMHKNNIFRFNLYSIDNPLTLDYYIKEFKFPNIKKESYRNLITVLGYEFELKNQKSYGFDEFKNIVYSMIDRVNYLWGRSNDLDVKYIWSELFSTYIWSEGVHNFSAKCNTPKFRGMGKIYNNAQRVYTNEYTYTPPPKAPKRELNTLEKMLMFMGLKNSYTKKQLKKRYRKLALQYHPDKSTGDVDKFIYLKECFEYLN